MSDSFRCLMQVSHSLGAYTGTRSGVYRDSKTYFKFQKAPCPCWHCKMPERVERTSVSWAVVEERTYMKSPLQAGTIPSYMTVIWNAKVLYKQQASFLPSQLAKSTSMVMSWSHVS